MILSVTGMMTAVMQPVREPAPGRIIATPATVRAAPAMETTPRTTLTAPIARTTPAPAMASEPPAPAPATTRMTRAAAVMAGASPVSNHKIHGWARTCTGQSEEES